MYSLIRNDQLVQKENKIICQSTNYARERISKPLGAFRGISQRTIIWNKLLQKCYKAFTALTFADLPGCVCAHTFNQLLESPSIFARFSWNFMTLSMISVPNSTPNLACKNQLIGAWVINKVKVVPQKCGCVRTHTF